MIEFEKNPDVPLSSMDFLWVAIGLYKAAGLKVQTILLPNNNVIAFDQSMTSEAFLPDACARVLVNDHWVFSLPSTVFPLPLGALPPGKCRQGRSRRTDSQERICRCPGSPRRGFCDFERRGI